MRPSDVRVGEPLPEDAFDRKGNLLLRRGHVIASNWQREMLLDKAAFQADDDTEVMVSGAAGSKRAIVHSGSPLALVHSARQLMHAVLTQPPDTGFPDEVMEVAGMLTRACQANADVALATLLMSREGAYSTRHAVNVAIACQVVGEALQSPAEERLITMAAALTMNIGMAQLQDQLQAQAGPLSPEQRAAVRGHCEHGVAILAEHGVADALWLDTVRDHHERPDGSGYPAGKQGAAIGRPALLVGLADVYCARVAGRECRAAMSPTTAMRWLFLGEGAATDEKLAALFIKALGIYPPGTGVRLRNGSLGVVAKRGVLGHQPQVAAITTGDGLSLERPVWRTSSTDEGVFAVAGVVDLVAMGKEPEMELIWGSDAVDENFGN